MKKQAQIFNSLRRGLLSQIHDAFSPSQFLELFNDKFSKVMDKIRKEDDRMRALSQKEPNLKSLLSKAELNIKSGEVVNAFMYLSVFQERLKEIFRNLDKIKNELDQIDHDIRNEGLKDDAEARKEFERLNTKSKEIINNFIKNAGILNTLHGFFNKYLTPRGTVLRMWEKRSPVYAEMKDKIEVLYSDEKSMYDEMVKTFEDLSTLLAERQPIQYYNTVKKLHVDMMKNAHLYKAYHNKYMRPVVQSTHEDIKIIDGIDNIVDLLKSGDNIKVEDFNRIRSVISNITNIKKNFATTDSIVQKLTELQAAILASSIPDRWKEALKVDIKNQMDSLSHKINQHEEEQKVRKEFDDAFNRNDYAHALSIINNISSANEQFLISYIKNNIKGFENKINKASGVDINEKNKMRLELYIFAGLNPPTAPIQAPPAPPIVAPPASVVVPQTPAAVTNAVPAAVPAAGAVPAGKAPPPLTPPPSPTKPTVAPMQGQIPGQPIVMVNKGPEESIQGQPIVMVNQGPEEADEKKKWEEKFTITPSTKQEQPAPAVPKQTFVDLPVDSPKYWENKINIGKPAPIPSAPSAPAIVPQNIVMVNKPAESPLADEFSKDPLETKIKNEEKEISADPAVLISEPKKVVPKEEKNEVKKERGKGLSEEEVEAISSANKKKEEEKADKKAQIALEESGLKKELEDLIGKFHAKKLSKIKKILGAKDNQEYRTEAFKKAFRRLVTEIKKSVPKNDIILDRDKDKIIAALDDLLENHNKVKKAFNFDMLKGKSPKFIAIHLTKYASDIQEYDYEEAKSIFDIVNKIKLG